MTDSTVVALVVVVVVLAAVALAAWLVVRSRRRSRLQQQFGPEYDHSVQQRGRSTAERELAERAERHQRLNIRALDPQRRERHLADWRDTQTLFVDDPRRSLRQADLLVERVMDERGYPMGDFDQRSADLSVEHADVLGRYRQAHDIAVRDQHEGAGTEELRQGMTHYRALFDALLEPGAATSGTGAADGARRDDVTPDEPPRDDARPTVPRDHGAGGDRTEDDATIGLGNGGDQVTGDDGGNDADGTHTRRLRPGAEEQVDLRDRTDRTDRLGPGSADRTDHGG